MPTARIICPNGHLGFAPLKPASFQPRRRRGPDFIAADSGSDDVGPGPLGADICTSLLQWQTYDLEVMLLASRQLGVPMIIGSSGDTGSNSRVDLYRRHHPRHCPQARPEEIPARLLLLGGRQGIPPRQDARRRRDRGTGRPTAPDRGRSWTPRRGSSPWRGCIPFMELLARGPTSSSAAAAAMPPSLPRRPSTGAFPSRSPTTSARCWNARRSAPSPMAARRRSSARSSMAAYT